MYNFQLDPKSRGRAKNPRTSGKSWSWINFFVWTSWPTIPIIGLFLESKPSWIKASLTTLSWLDDNCPNKVTKGYSSGITPFVKLISPSSITVCCDGIS